MTEFAATGSVPVVASVLDRLLNGDSGRLSAYSVRQLKEDLLRDLESLLNTRAPELFWPDSLTELGDSLLTYGRPNLDSTGLDEVRELQRRIESVILRWEPRISALAVKVIREPTATDRTVEFRIDATLHAIPEETISFGPEIDLSSGAVKVRRRSGR